MSGRPGGSRSTAQLRPPTTGRCTAPPKCAPSATISTAITAGIIRRRRFSSPPRWRRCRIWSPAIVWLRRRSLLTPRPSPAFSALRTGVLFALGFPAAIWNVTAGQNGFLTAALIGGTLGLLERHPALGRDLLGLLTYKPQFGLLFPHRADRRPALADHRGRHADGDRARGAVVARLRQRELGGLRALGADFEPRR